ncbi:MAG: PAS domain S-box protein, partial [Cyanobacteria bacterium J06638_6]
VNHVFPDDLVSASAYCQKSVETRQDHQFEYRMIAADGSIVWIHDIVKLVCEGSRVVKLVGLLLDISERKRGEAERKQTETALWESKQLLQRVIDSVPQSIFWKDRQSVYLGCNQNFAYDAGLQHPKEVIGKTDYDLPWLPAESEFYRQIDQEVMASGQPQFRFIEQQHPANGDETWIETSKVLLENAAGQVVGILGTYEDITQRKAIEEALGQSEARLRALFEQSTVGIALVDGGGQLYQVNEAYAAITGYSAEELLHMDCTALTHPDERAHSRRGIAELLAGEKGSLSLEKRYICKDGQQRWVSLNLSPVLVHKGEPLNFLAAIVVDITARKQAEQELVQRIKQEQAFNRVVQTIRSSLDLNIIFSAAVREASYLLDIGRAGIVQYLAKRQCWVHVMEYRRDPAMPDRTGLEIPDADNPFAARLKRLELVQVDSPETIADPMNRTIADQSPGAWLLTPLIVSGELWGSLSLLKDSPATPFSQAQVELAKRFADQLAIAIQQSTLYAQLQAANQQLHHLATHDPLTQLANRRYFDEYLTGEWSRLTRSQKAAWVSLILCDIDYFKQYNDCYGHPQGDTCLVSVAQALGDGVRRPADILARYGGEEFAVILPETDEAGAIQVVHQMQAAIATANLPHAASQVSTQITLSFGVACIYRQTPAPSQPPQLLLQRADRALYRAKLLGRNRYEVSVAVL